MTTPQRDVPREQRMVGCEAENGLLHIHPETETCVICASPAAAPAAPAPVAWMYEFDGCKADPCFSPKRWEKCNEPWTETPLYAAPAAAPADDSDAFLRGYNRGRQHAEERAAAPAAPAPDAPIRDALERLVHLRFVEEYPQDNEWDSAWIAGRDSLAHVCGDACPHASSCAVHNAPALPVGPCDCGAALSLPDAWPGLAAPAAAPAAPAPAPDAVALVQRLRGHVDDAEYIISGESKPHPLMAEAADLIEQQARALAKAQRDLHTAKMDRNTYDHAHKRQAAATLEATARAERAESALAARDAAIAAERREASLLYGKVRHEFYVLGYGEAVADRRMSEQFPITTKIWIAENDAARAQIGETK